MDKEWCTCRRAPGEWRKATPATARPATGPVSKVPFTPFSCYTAICLEKQQSASHRYYRGSHSTHTNSHNSQIQAVTLNSCLASVMRLQGKGTFKSVCLHVNSQSPPHVHEWFDDSRLLLMLQSFESTVCPHYDSVTTVVFLELSLMLVQYRCGFAHPRG